MACWNQLRGGAFLRLAFLRLALLRGRFRGAGDRLLAGRLRAGRRGLVFFGRLDAISVRGVLAGSLPQEAAGRGEQA